MIDSVSESAGALPDFKKARRRTAASRMIHDAASRVDRLPPHSIEAEQGVLGCLLLDPKTCFEQCAVQIQSPEDFYDLRHQTVWSAILDGGPQKLDIILLQQNLKDRGLLDQIGGVAYLNALQDAVPSAANLSYYLDYLIEKSQLRKLIHTCTDVVGRVYEYDGEFDQLLDEVEHDIAKIATTRSDRVIDGKQSVHLLTHDLERRMNNRCAGVMSGLRTGWVDFDRLTDGLQLGEQVVIGARPSFGKTSIATNLIENICLKDGVPSAFVTCEMRPEALLRRMCASQCEIPMRDLRNGNISETEMGKIATFSGKIRNAPISWINGIGGINERQVCSEIRRVVRKHGVKFVAVDYLQKIKTAQKEEKKTYEVGNVSSALNALAKELNISIVTLAQLNRDSEKAQGKKSEERPPRLTDLGDSKQIEQDADLIALLHRKRTNEPAIPTQLIIAKQRDGELGVVDLTFRGSYCRFENAASEEEVPQ